MHDQDIREFLRRDLQQRHGGDPETKVIDELSIGGGRSRIDLALVNGVLHGFEIKSNYDTLSRLPEQAKLYGTVCDRMTLVVGERLIRSAIDHLPDWWGVTLVRADDAGQLEFCNFKFAQTNPSLDAMAVARFLHRSEAVAFVVELGSGSPSQRVSRQELCRFLAKNVKLPVLCERVRTCIRARQSLSGPRSYGD